MSIPTYNEGYPLDGSSLGQTKATIRNNLDGTFFTLAVDHVNNNGLPGPNPAGYHTVIHEVTQTTVSTMPGFNQIFSGVPGTLSVNSNTTPAIPPNGDTQLYTLTGMGGLSQLTGNHSNPSGYQWIGGVLLMWGVYTAPSTGIPVSGPISFTPNFPNNCYNVQMTPIGGSISSQTLQVGSPLSTTGFTFKFSFNGNNSYTGFYWTAIGN